MKTSSQGFFLLIDVRSDEKTARRAVVLVQNADMHAPVTRETGAEALFLKKRPGSECLT